MHRWYVIDAGDHDDGKLVPYLSPNICQISAEHLMSIQASSDELSKDKSLTRSVCAIIARSKLSLPNTD